MPRNVGTTVENQFIQGLITEATGLNFPEKAVAECWNVRFEKTGNITRRLGYAYEDDITEIPGGGATALGVCKSYLWRAVGTDGSKTFLVIQSGQYLSFYEPDSNGNFSGGVKSFQIDLGSYKTPVAGLSVAEAEAGISSGNGRLFVNHPYCEPIYVEYESDADDITVIQYEIRIRDMEGVDDGLEPGERPGSLSNLHKYNLYNQGWDQGTVNWGFNESGTPIAVWKIALGKYPSNSDVWWYGKGVNKEGKEGLQLNTIKLVSKATGFAPKGHYVYNAFSMDRSSKSGISGIPSKSSEGLRPNTVAFYAGRVWYAGVAHPDYQGKVYYTQIIESDTQIGACYQANDPTSEQLSDLLDTDGGEIKVTGMGKVTTILEFGNSLLIFANNGIWSISGSGAEGTGFVATNFSIKKISNIGTEAGNSFVDVEGTPVWWNYDGIWTFSPDSGVQSLTNNTIKTFLQNEVPGVNRRYVQGAYNPLQQTIQWMWKSEVPTDIPDAYRYDRILEFNVETKAFYPFKWNGPDQYFSTIFCATDITSTSLAEDIVTDSIGDTVTDSTAAAVTANIVENVSYTSAKYKYFATNI